MRRRLRISGVRVATVAVGLGVLNAATAAGAARATLIATLLTIRIVLLEGGDGLGDLTICLEVFPESDLGTVNDHLVIRFVQFTTQLYE